MATDKNEKEKKNEEQTKPENEPKTTDPQEEMEGPVSSLVQRGKEAIEDKGDKKGHEEQEEKEKKDEQE